MNCINSIIKNQIEQYHLSKDYFNRSLDFIKDNNVYLTNKHIRGNNLTYFKLPEYMFCIGDDSILNRKTIGIVGSRKPDDYAINFLERLFKKIDKDYITVSGFALGVDSLVHKLSIKYNIKTIAVTGAGFAINYPSSNRALKEKIAENGLLLSEYSPYIKPFRANFLKRNFIIAMISDIIVIVRGNNKSGTLSTLNYALSLNKKIYALPGRIDELLSFAPNYAISKGAIPIYDIDQLEFINKRKTKLKLNKEEKLFMQMIKKNNSIDTLLNNKSFTREQIFSIIIKLELKNIIKREKNNKILILEDVDE